MVLVLLAGAGQNGVVSWWQGRWGSLEKLHESEEGDGDGEIRSSKVKVTTRV